MIVIGSSINSFLDTKKQRKNKELFLQTNFTKTFIKKFTQPSLEHELHPHKQGKLV